MNKKLQEAIGLLDGGKIVAIAEGAGTTEEILEKLDKYFLEIYKMFECRDGTMSFKDAVIFNANVAGSISRYHMSQGRKGITNTRRIS